MSPGRCSMQLPGTLDFLSLYLRGAPLPALCNPSASSIRPLTWVSLHEAREVVGVPVDVP